MEPQESSLALCRLVIESAPQENTICDVNTHFESSLIFTFCPMDQVSMNINVALLDLGPEINKISIFRYKSVLQIKNYLWMLFLNQKKPNLFLVKISLSFN